MHTHMSPPKANHPRRGFVFALTAAVLAAIVTLAASGVLSANATTVHAAAAPAAPTISSQFPVFNLAATTSDAVPSNFAAQLTSQFQSEQPNLAGARKVAADNGQTAYLVPTQTGLCVINTSQAFCVPTAQAAGAAAVRLCSPTLPAGQMEIEWLLPAGATNISLEMNDGTTQAYPAGSSVYIARLPLTALPRSIVWQSSTGQQQTAPTPVPPGMQAPLCAAPPTQTAQTDQAAPRHVREHATIVNIKRARKLSSLHTAARKP
jgi:hypothetical protein